MTPIPEKSSVGFKPVGLICPECGSVDGQVAELEAALKIATDSLRIINNACQETVLTFEDQSHIATEASQKALSLIQKTLSRDLPN